jgi:hypothetical protein
MLFAVIGGAIVAVLIAGSVSLLYFESLTIPPRDLVRRWRAETAPRGRIRP